MRYSFSLNPKIKGFVEWQLEHYQEEKKQLEEHKRDLIPSPTQNYSLSGGVQSGGTSNPTEQIGMRLATSAYITAAERSIKAIETTLDKCDHTDLRLIKLVYWQRTHTVEGAGMVVGLSRRGAYKRINKILCAIAMEMGVINL